MTSKVNIGVVGCGVIGGALKRWIEEHNKNCDIHVMDPQKGYQDDLSSCDCIFISIHIPTNEQTNTQDLDELETIISELPDIPIFIRTTVLPGTSDTLAQKYNRKVYFMPEFLTERTANQDFASQSVVFCGETALLKRIFVNKPYIEMSNVEAEIAKYAHNVFGALKVTYFNGINELCEMMGCDYSNVQKGVLLSGYINEPHTSVPGPDGKFGYGGKCFPKDQTAFDLFTKDLHLNKLIAPLAVLNQIYRNK